jgi:hypothetical protein
MRMGRVNEYEQEEPPSSSADNELRRQLGSHLSYSSADRTVRRLVLLLSRVHDWQMYLWSGIKYILESPHSPL